MAHVDDKAASEGALQSALTTATTEAQRKTAQINHLLRMITAARTWHVKNGSMSALLALGGNPPSGSWTSDDS